MFKSRRAKVVWVAVLLFVATPLITTVTVKWARVRAATRSAELVAEGDQLKVFGLWYAAKPCYETALNGYAYNGTAVSARLGLAECLEVTRPDDAIALYNEVAGSASDTDTRASAQLAAARVRMRVDADAARSEFEAIQQVYPGTLAAHQAALGLAECCEAKGQYKLAEAKYKAVAASAEGTPVAPEALYKTGQMHVRTGQLGRASAGPA